MATTSRFQLDWQQQTTPCLRHTVPVACLPFPAALVDRSGTIVETSPEWDNIHPGFSAGSCSADWCHSLPAGAADATVPLLEGLRRVVSGAQRRFSHEMTMRSAHRRVLISATVDGALIVLERGPERTPAPSPRSPRLETIGRTVSGVAHDFANLLTLITGYGDMLLNRTGVTDPERAEINEILKAAERGSRLTSQLLGFTRTPDVHRRPVDLNQLVADVHRMLRPILGEHLELVLKLDPEVGQVIADPGQMEQVLMNLLLNARDAMPGGGSIRIETSSMVLGPEQAAGLNIAPGKCVLLSVADTGQGIEPDEIERIFQPFYTTKDEGEGTGLGLSIVLRIVRESGGAIRVRSTPGRGARFFIYLPDSGRSDGSGETAKNKGAAPRGSETLLIVEDDEAVRLLMARILTQHGYGILEAANGEEALQVLEAQKTSIRLVLTDMIMPRMGGRELAAKLRPLYPELPIVCVSGYTDEVLQSTGNPDAGMSFLRKPLRPEMLAAKVREALDSPSRPFNPR